MNATFFQRLCAYFIDVLIIGIIFSLITANINLDKRKELNEELNNFILEVSASETYTEEQAEKLLDIQYNIEKESVFVNGISLLVIVAYFVIFQFINNGQTIGKKLFKLRVVNIKENNKITILQILLRTLIIYGIVNGILNLIFISNFDKITYLSVYSIINTIKSIFVIVSMLFILYRKDKKGLHDLMSNTYVICERGN